MKYSLFRLCLIAIAWPLVGCSEDLVVFVPDPDEGMLEPAPASADDARAPRDMDASLLDAGMDAGLGSAIDAAFSDEPPSPAGPRTITAFSQTCAIRKGDLYCWGDNRLGQCGEQADAGTHGHRFKGPFIEACAGEHHSCALREGGEALCWGSNRTGQLGVGDDGPRSRPTAIRGFRFRSIACGGDSSCAIDERGALFCWGDNFEGKLGTETTPDPSSSALPVRVGSFKARKVSVGQGHACAIAEGGALYCWGRNTDMQVGIASTDPQHRTPQRVDPASTYQHVSAGQQHSCAIRGDGHLTCWGNRAPRAGDGPQPIGPRLVDGELDYEDVSVGWFHSCARRRGALFCWGRNTEGQLGLGDKEYRVAPTRVGDRDDWTRITVGHLHTCGERTGDLYCWGDNEFGQLGPNDRERRYRPSLYAPP